MANDYFLTLEGFLRRYRDGSGTEDWREIFEGDAGTAYTAVRYEFNEYEDGGLRVATGITDQEVPMGTVTLGKFVYMKTSQDITVKFNGIGSTGILLQAGKLLMAFIDFTSVHVSNASGSEAKVQRFFAGDPT